MLRIDKLSGDFENVLWVADAVSKDETRRALWNVLITKEQKAVATDGHRLHIADLKFGPEDGYEAGQYEIIKRTKKEIVLQRIDDALADNYPPYEQVSPKIPKGMKSTAANERDDAVAIVVRGMETGFISCEYTSDALGCDKDGKYGKLMEIYVFGDAKPIVFKSDGRHAVVMPKRNKL